MPSDPEAAKQLGKGYPHSKEEIEKQAETTKLKGSLLEVQAGCRFGEKEWPW